MIWLGLGILGVVVGGIGTLIGAGGGFLLMPVLLLMYPADEPRTLASISLAVVAFNSVSGTIGYARKRLIDYRSGLLFALAGVPGAILGALLVAHIERRFFSGFLGCVLACIAVFLLIAGRARPNSHPASPAAPSADHAAQPPRRRALGVVISFLVGVLSSLLGIGGGIIHVPAMVYALGFPVHTATATSHFVLASTSVAGTAVHIGTGAFHAGFRRALALGVGAVIGAQFGAMLSTRVRSTLIIRLLAVAMLLVSLRLIWTAIAGKSA